jgi:A nuclease family of the HNH/ENDO VII superfamily with conserved AHH
VAIPQTTSAVRVQMPADIASAYAILDGLTGSRSATMAMLDGTRWPGAELAGPDLPRAAPRPIRIAGAGALAMTDAGSIALPSIGDVAVERLLGGALRIGGAVFTAAILLNDVSAGATRAQVLAAIARFGLDPNQAADVLAARAYVTTRTYLPGVYLNLPWTGPVLDRTAEAIMRYERERPGTMMLAGRGNPAAVAAISQLVAEYTAGVLDAVMIAERTSAVDPALSTSSANARAILGLAVGQLWQAHHLIPFAVMANLPVPFQQAVVTAGWRMDSAENLIALPANLATYMAPPNSATLPMHNSAHPGYDADVSAALVPVVTAGLPIIPIPNAPMNPRVLQQYAANPGALRAGLKAVEDLQRTRLFARRYNPRVS